MANESLPAGAPAPRLCHLVKWPDHDEYGFNLHAEKAKLGQFIGKVDADSPAFYSGLLEGDRIVEVNDVNISNENHRQVVERIKAIPNETRLLVVDKPADEWYKERKLIVKGTQKNVIYKKNPANRPNTNNQTNLPNNVKENGDSLPEPETTYLKEEAPGISSEAPAPRLCHLVKWPDFVEYGFNLHSQSGGDEYVGKVDPDSPASLAGLKEGDRIIEVNGTPVATAGASLVQLIKAEPGEARLLVLDPEGERWYRERGLLPRSTQPNVIYQKTPVPRPEAAPANGSIPPPEPPVLTSLPEDAPAPRLCQLYKWPDFDGYGFSLHAEKGRDGQYVGKVDPDSPAEFAGLLEGDHIVEVNGVSVETDGHRLLVQRIKANPSETRLLVVDAKSERWYRERGMVPKSSQPNVITMRTPVPRPAHAKNRGEVLPEEVTTKLEEVKLNTTTTQQESRSSTPQSTACTTGSAQESPRSTHSGHGSPPPPPASELNLNMSVSEMRQMLAARKKYDPKKVQMDLRDKYNIIQEM